MATAKPYNPVVKVEGMFNGCVMRIAQAIKNPVEFGENTKLVIQECAKQFQDALDDCEIQILDAKWYLEHQLALNKAKREAKAREETAAVTKRKHDQIQDAGEKDGREEEVKRVKLEVPMQEAAKKSPKPLNQEALTPEPTKSEAVPVPSKPVEELENSLSKPEEKPLKKPPDPTKAPEKPPDQSTENPSQPVTDFPQSTPQVTPAPTNDEFNFVSMFGDPSQDAPPGDTNEDINFDLDLGDGFGSNLDGADDSNQNQGDLDSLLPGLESYANQPENENNDLNSSNNQAMNFNLPPLDGPNEFDAFLDANPFENTAMEGDMNLTDEAMNIDNMDNMDFDSMFADP